MDLHNFDQIKLAYQTHPDEFIIALKSLEQQVTDNDFNPDKFVKSYQENKPDKLDQDLQQLSNSVRASYPNNKTESLDSIRREAEILITNNFDQNITNPPKDESPKTTVPESSLVIQLGRLVTSKSYADIDMPEIVYQRAQEGKTNTQTLTTATQPAISPEQRAVSSQQTKYLSIILELHCLATLVKAGKI